MEAGICSSSSMLHGVDIVKLWLNHGKNLQPKWPMNLITSVLLKSMLLQMKHQKNLNTEDSQLCSGFQKEEVFQLSMKAVEIKELGLNSLLKMPINYQKN